MLANFLVVFLVIFLFLIAYILVRTILYGQAIEPVQPAELAQVDGDVVAGHLSAVLRHSTVSQEDRARIDYTPFQELRRELERLYPRVHAALKVETVNRHSLLYTWAGRDPTLPPVLLAGHMDVVPVDPASRDEWKHPPFEGRIDAGCVWGRGALDTKNTVISALEAVEALLKADYQPERTLLLGFGHDEEIGGQQGAAQIAGRLLASGIRLEALLDEGGGILSEGIPGLRLPVGLIGVAEKGYLTLDLTVEGRGGHSSMPPQHTSIGVLARALTRLEGNPLPAHLEMAAAMFRRLGSFLPFGLRAVLANLWLFHGALKRRLSADSRTNAMLRTTTAVTMINGGVKDNLLPAHAHALVNFRLMPGDRVADVEMHVRKTIHDDAVQIHIPEGAAWEASPVSPFESPAAAKLLRVLAQVYPETVSAPYLVSGATDSRHYSQVCDHIFRFSPYLMSAEELRTIHASNERISIAGLARMVQFYIQLVKVWTERPDG
jgi:carboxypeptidase PM20D1